MRNFFAALAVITILTASAAFAGVFGGSGGGLSVGVANTLYCALAGCTMADTITFNKGGVNGTIVPQSGSTVFTLLANNATFGAVRLSQALLVGVQGNAAATTEVLAVNDGLGAASSGTQLAGFWGEGKFSIQTQQTATCAAGVLALDPTSSVVYVNANNAACVITLGESNAIAGSDIEIVLTSNVSGAVTFPNVANVHAGPVLCTTTGLSTIGSSYRIHYAATLNEYVGVACNSN